MKAARDDAAVNATTLAQRQAALTALFAAVGAAPYHFDFFALMRRVESLRPESPRIGKASRPSQEALRLGQEPELDFAPAALATFAHEGGAAPRLGVRFFGLLGSQGPMPLHLTEYARDRATHHADPTLQRFLDLITHRFALLFYRAWAEAQPTVSFDRPGSKATFNRLGALVGLGLPTLQDRDALPDTSKLYFAGRLARQTRDADGLLAWCKLEFDVPIAIEQWCGHWMPLGRSERSRLGKGGGALVGRGAVLGASVWDVQHKFRIRVGPLGLAQYRRFLPSGADVARLQALVRCWVGIEFAWDLKLVLLRSEVPRYTLGARGIGLGHALWMGHYRRSADAADLCFDVESTRAAKVAPSTLPAEADFSTWPLQPAAEPA